MGANTSAEYELTSEEKLQISKAVTDFIQPFSEKLKSDIKYYVVKKQYILLQKPEHYNTLLPIGKVSMPSPRRQGWVQKEGGKVKTWKRRYLTLNSQLKLQYYVTFEDYQNGKQKGELDFSSHIVIDGLKFCTSMFL